VHAVERTQERRLAAARGSDERRHGAFGDRDGDVLDREEVAVVDVEVADLDALGHGGYRSPLGLKWRDTRRATMLRTITMTMSRSAAPQARAIAGSGGTPGCMMEL